jgi:hypothetical protein
MKMGISLSDFLYNFSTEMWRNGSAVDCLSNGCGFEPHHFRFFKYTEIFQLVEFGLWEPEVVSSSLAFRTKDVLSFGF